MCVRERERRERGGRGGRGKEKGKEREIEGKERKSRWLLASS